MSELTISNLGLIILIVPVLVHGIEVLFPTQARWVVNWILPFFAPALPSRTKSLELNEQITMLDAAIQAAPEGKKRAGADYVFLLMFEQRQGAICFAAVAAGALYGLTLGIVDRDALHVVFGVVALLMTLVNANQAGFKLFGNHPRVSTNGKHLGFVFTPFWLIATGLNWLGLTYAIA
jgi:hypothetical protein